MNPRFLLLACATLLAASLVRADQRLTLAAASNVKFAMDEIVADFRLAHPAARVEVIYGSSGKFHAQIQHGAPLDLFFSADALYPRLLAEKGFAASDAALYAIGRLVLWRGQTRDSPLSMESLKDAAVRRIAIANPRHAPYGQRAEEALRATGVWEAVKPKLVFGENIAQAAQFVRTGNAEVGVVALSVVYGPELEGVGEHWLVPQELHAPLEQAFILTRRAAGNDLAWRFAEHMRSAAAREALGRAGFELPPMASKVEGAAR